MGEGVPGDSRPSIVDATDVPATGPSSGDAALSDAGRTVANLSFKGTAFGRASAYSARDANPGVWAAALPRARLVLHVLMLAATPVVFALSWSDLVGANTAIADGPFGEYDSEAWLTLALAAFADVFSALFIAIRLAGLYALVKPGWSLRLILLADAAIGVALAAGSTFLIACVVGFSFAAIDETVGFPYYWYLLAASALTAGIAFMYDAD